MFDNKTVLIAATLLLGATDFCIHQVNLGKKLRPYSEIKSESLR